MKFKYPANESLLEGCQRMTQNRKVVYQFGMLVMTGKNQTANHLGKNEQI